MLLEIISVQFYNSVLFVSLTFSRDRLFLMEGKILSKAAIPHRKPEVWSLKKKAIYFITFKVFGQEYDSKATP